MVVLDPSRTSAHPVEQALLAGPLGRAGGVAQLDDLVDAHTVRQLTREAMDMGAQATRQEGPTALVDDGRGDVAGRVLGSAPGGPVQDALYASSALHRRLGSLCGATIAPTGGRGSYSYYTRQGDHLDVHVDIVTCDVTVITVVHDSTPPDDVGGALAVFSSHIGAPLHALRDRTVEPTAVICAPRFASIVLLGGLVPHAVLPLGEHGTRVISALCFEASL